MMWRSLLRRSLFIGLSLALLAGAAEAKKRRKRRHPQRDGWFFGARLGWLNDLNAKIESDYGEPKHDVSLAVDFGYVFKSNLGVGLSHDVVQYTYENRSFIDRPYGISMHLSSLSPKLFYFLPITRHFELMAKAGPALVLSSISQRSTNSGRDEEEQTTIGIYTGLELLFYPSKRGSFAINAELYHWRHGVEWREVNQSESLNTTGLLFGFRFR